MDRSLATKEVPLLNRDEPYIPDAGRTREDDEALIYDAKGVMRERTHISARRFEEIYNSTMKYYTVQEKYLFRQYQSGEKKPEHFYEDAEKYLKRTFPKEMDPAENPGNSDWDLKVMMNRLNLAMFGYDVIQPLIDNKETSDIKICGPYDIRVRVKGKAYKSNATFIDEDDLFRFVDGLAIRNRVDIFGHPVITFTDSHDPNYIMRFTVSSPMVCAVDYPYLHIRKVPKNKPMFDDLIKAGMLNEKVKMYLIDRAKASKGIVFAGPPGCVDRETEFFDGKQWKSLADYKKGDLVLQYDPASGEASLVEPLAYIKKKCDKMYHFETRQGIDQTLSPEHRVLYANKTHLNGKKVWSKKVCEMSAEELKDKQNAGSFNGGFITSFKYNGKGIKLKDVEIELMLAVICDGTFDKRKDYYNRCTINIKKQRKIEEMDDLMKRWGGEYKRKECPNGYVRYVFAAPRKEKEFTDEWYSCSKKQLKLICENILKWDGSITKNGRRTFCSTSKATADFVQFAFSACGYRATVHLDKRAGQTYMTGGKQYIRKNDSYTICISENTIVGMAYHNDGRDNNVRLEEVKPSDGYKYCFTVPTHALVLRRNGKIFITGNSGKTTALNAFIEWIPKTRESLVIQENDELQTRQSGFMFKHVTHGFHGEPSCTLEDLAKMALVEGCNEFIIGEVKGGEMRYAMTLVNAGGYAALTVHSTNAYETLDKLADLVKYGSSYSFEEARRMLKTFDTIVYMEGYKVREILENTGYNDETGHYNYINIYRYDPEAERAKEREIERLEEEERKREEEALKNKYADKPEDDIDAGAITLGGDDDDE